MKIYNSIRKSISLLAIILFSMCPVFSTQTGHLEYNSIVIDYDKFNKNELYTKARLNLDKYLKATSEEEKEIYLNNALGHYYILSKIDYSQLDPHIKLGRIYDIKNKQRLAKEQFSQAININSNDKYANFYFGNFYYRRKDYTKALKFYRKAYANGLNNYEINFKLAVIYEKLGDLLRAQMHYQTASKLNPNTTELQEKIQLINELKYPETGYYDTIRE